MKVYDPAFELAEREADEMDDIRFVQINHLHPNNKLYLSEYRIKRFDDLPGCIQAAGFDVSEGPPASIPLEPDPLPDSLDETLPALALLLAQGSPRFRNGAVSPDSGSTE